LASSPLASSGASLVAPGLAAAQDSAPAKVTEGKQLYKQKKFQEAAATFEQAIAIDPSISDAYMGLGRTYEKLDRADDALAIYERAYKKFPISPTSSSAKASSIARSSAMTTPRKPTAPTSRSRPMTLTPTMASRRPSSSR
jgi:tetratricopeptide (TPR) repeat protein